MFAAGRNEERGDAWKQGRKSDLVCPATSALFAASDCRPEIRS